MSSETPHQKPPETEGGQGPFNVHSGQTAPPIPPTSAVSQFPPTPDQNPESTKKNRDWVDYTTMGLEIFGLIVLISYTTFAGLQWRANKQSADAATNAAHVATETLKANNLSNWRAQRAWVIASAKQEVSFSGPVSMNIEIENLGITEAKTFTGFATIMLLKKGEMPDLEKKRWKTNLGINVLVPKFHKSVLIKAYKENPDQREELLTSEIAPGMKDGSLSMLVYGTFNYVDAWKVPHWIKFCNGIGAYNAGYDRQNDPCADYNQSDENEPKQIEPGSPAQSF